MARNLELKVRCLTDDLRTLEARAIALDPMKWTTLRQIDTYFAAARGRLKLREITPETGPASAELIAYHRPDESGPRWSSYHRIPIPVTDAPALREALAETVGRRVTVAKRRTVAIVGRTRVHLDLVDELGGFVELETVIADHDETGAEAELTSVARALGLEAYERIAGSYADLLESMQRERDNG